MSHPIHPSHGKSHETAASSPKRDIPRVVLETADLTESKAAETFSGPIPLNVRGTKRKLGDNSYSTRTIHKSTGKSVMASAVHVFENKKYITLVAPRLDAGALSNPDKQSKRQRTK